MKPKVNGKKKASTYVREQIDKLPLETSKEEMTRWLELLRDTEWNEAVSRFATTKTAKTKSAVMRALKKQLNKQISASDKGPKTVTNKYVLAGLERQKQTGEIK